MILAVIFVFGKLPPQIPLLYSRPTGELQLAEWWLILLLPLLMNGLFVLNTYLKKKIFHDSAFINSFLKYIKIFIIVSLTLIFLKIIFLVT